MYTAIVSIRRFSEPTSALLLFKLFAVLLLALKSAVNFVVYCWFSEKFRVTLRRVFHCEETSCQCCYGCRASQANVDARYCSLSMHVIVHDGNQ